MINLNFKSTLLFTCLIIICAHTHRQLMKVPLKHFNVRNRILWFSVAEAVKRRFTKNYVTDMNFLKILELFFTLLWFSTLLTSMYITIAVKCMLISAQNFRFIWSIVKEYEFVMLYLNICMYCIFLKYFMHMFQLEKASIKEN